MGFVLYAGVLDLSRYTCTRVARKRILEWHGFIPQTSKYVLPASIRSVIASLVGGQSASRPPCFLIFIFLVSALSCTEGEEDGSSSSRARAFGGACREVRETTRGVTGTGSGRVAW